jgi:class 3 adenylate cyclase
MPMGAELPTGTVTFLFTDLEGSTRLWEEHPEAMKEVLARHDEILREAVEAQGGVVVKTTGDGLHAAFASAEAALLAAAAGQVSLAAAHWERTGPLRVRMGIHTGAGELRDGDYFGPALNRAARVTAVAHGGQVLVSLATEELVRDSLSPELGLVELGEHRLRDLSRPERVFQLQVPGVAFEFPALRSLDVLPGNLPVQLTSFVGREEELARVAGELGQARLVSLTGVGGVGKTRLALEVAAEVVPEYRDGAWLIELAGVRDAEAVPDAVVATFGLQPARGRSATDRATRREQRPTPKKPSPACTASATPTSSRMRSPWRPSPSAARILTARFSSPAKPRSHSNTASRGGSPATSPPDEAISTRRSSTPPRASTMRFGWGTGPPWAP